MTIDIEQQVLRATQADGIASTELIQTLWSGYGAIKRIELIGGNTKSLIVKHVMLPDQQSHPRGWNTSFSHQRKIKSYQVESAWYENYSAECDETCRIPRCLGAEASNNEFLIMLEDLDQSGFPGRRDYASLCEIYVCIEWLAHFHGTFMQRKPEKLWSQGTYWHLETRPDELSNLEDKDLRKAAPEIDRRLSETPYLTLVHGDAKLANFCFASDGSAVAAVDFQYVGGGCGMKDLAYFIGSCLREDDCQKYEPDLIDHYFHCLNQALTIRGSRLDPSEIEKAWRPLFEWAWTDFHRFVKGWSPGHWKINSYSEKLAASVLQQIKTP